MAQSRRRQQVDPILSNRVQGRETLRPQAAPVSAYTPARLPKPDIDAFVDLAPLSDTVTKILTEMRTVERSQERELLLGAAADPERLEALNTGREVARAVNQDGVPINLSPYHFPEGKRLAGAWLAQKYHREMERRKDEYTQIQGEDGTPLDAAKPRRTYQDVANEVRAKIAADSAIYADPLSRASFNKEMLALDQKLQLEATILQERNRDEFIKDGLGNEMGAMMDEIAVTGWDDQSRERVQKWDFQHTTERPVVTKKDSLQILMRQAFTTASGMAKDGRHDEAALFLEEFGKVRIAGVPLEDNKAAFGNSTFQTELENQITAMENRAEVAADNELRDTQRAIAKAAQQEEATWLGIVNQAQEIAPGGDPLDALIYNGVFDGIRDRHTPAVAEAVIDQIRKQVRQGHNQSRNDDADDALTKLWGDGNIEAMDAYLASAMVPSQQRLYWSEKIREGRAKAARLDEIPEYADTLQSLDQSFRGLPVSEMPPSVQDEMRNQYFEETNALRQEINSMASDSLTPEGAAKIRERLVTRSEEIRRDLQTRTTAFVEQRREALDAVNQAESSNGDMNAVYDQYYAMLSREDQDKLRKARDDYNTSITQTLISPQAVQPFGAMIDALKTGAVVDAGGMEGVAQDLPSMLADERALKGVYDKALRDAYTSKLSGTPKGREPVILQEAVNEALVQTFSEIPGVDMAVMGRVGEGQPVAEAMEEAVTERAWADQADEMQQRLIRGGDMTAFQNVFPQAAQHLSQRDLQKVSDYYTAGSMADKARAKKALLMSAADAMDDGHNYDTLVARGTARGEREAYFRRAEALMSVVGVSPEDALRGAGTFYEALPHVEFSPNKGMLFGNPVSITRMGAGQAGQTREEVIEQVRQAEAWLDSKPTGSFPRARRNLDMVRRALEGREFPIDAGTFNPYTSLKFRLDEIEQWQSDGRWERLLDTYGIADEEAFENAMIFRASQPY